MPDRNRMLDELLRIFPDSLIDTWDNIVGTWKGRDGYYRALQSCKVVISLPGAGYDTFRYWENAACNAIHVAKRMPLLIPNDLRDNREIIKFTGVMELASLVERALADELDWHEYGARSLAWLRACHTTEHRARMALDILRASFAI